MFKKDNMPHHTKITPIEDFDINPLGYIKTPIIQHGILECRVYDAVTTTFGYPRPGFFRANENSNILRIAASENDPLSIVFSTGLVTDTHTEYPRRFKSFIKKYKQTKRIELSETSYIYAQVDSYEDNTIQFGSIPKSVSENVYFDVKEPDNPQEYDYWYDIKENWLKKYEWSVWANEFQWNKETKVILGLVGVGNDGYIYSMQTWFPNKGIADMWNKFYDNSENPYMHYDGVSFVTDGKFTAQNAPEWVDSHEICEAVSNNPLALAAVEDSQTAIDAINNSNVAQQYFNI